MEQTLVKKMMPTVSLATARIFVGQLEARDDDLAHSVASQIQGRITVAQLSGQSRVDLEVAIVDSIEVDTSIDALVDTVIDLR